MITKPMLATACEDFSKLDFKNNKYLATPKLDGIRALMIDGKLVSRKFKSIRNKYIRETLEALLPEGADGEIICPGGSFQVTTGNVMRADGKPEFTFYWFDYVTDDINKPYYRRMSEMALASVKIKGKKKYIELLMPTRVKDLEELKKYEQKCIDDGFEGAMLRTFDGPYKCGRATEKQQWLLKIKRFEDSEAIILSIGEKMHNENEAKKDAFGRTERSTCKAGLVPAGTMGKLYVRDTKTKVEFEIGTGFNDKLRQEIWDNQKKWIGLMVKYKHFAVTGVKDKPRFPVFLGLRDEDDL